MGRLVVGCRVGKIVTAGVIIGVVAVVVTFKEKVTEVVLGRFSSLVWLAMIVSFDESSVVVVLAVVFTVGV